MGVCQIEMTHPHALLVEFVVIERGSQKSAQLASPSKRFA